MHLVNNYLESIKITCLAEKKRANIHQSIIFVLHLEVEKMTIEEEKAHKIQAEIKITGYRRFGYTVIRSAGYKEKIKYI